MVEARRYYDNVCMQGGGAKYMLSMCIRRGRDRTGWVEEEMAVTEDSCKEFCFEGK